MDAPQPVRRLTQEPHSFFGYYDKCPWSADGTRILTGRAAFNDRQPQSGDALELAYLDVRDGTRHAFATTTAWSWQQGCMLQWLPSGAVLYNTRDSDGRAICAIQDLETGTTRALPRPVCYVGRSGRRALSIDFHRLHVTRAGYGYPPALELTPDRLAPEDDGLWEMDLATGETRLILSLAEAGALGAAALPSDAWYWLNHATYSPDESRIAVLHRWAGADWPAETFLTRLLTLDTGGGGLHLLNGSGFTSHFVWRDDAHLLAWASPLDPDGSVRPPGYYLFADGAGVLEQIGRGALTRDGHVTYSADGAWLLTDEYPREDDGSQVLTLYDLRRDRRVDVGRFAADPRLTGPLRCDLHPRFSPDGRTVCIDSAHDGARHMYLVDVTAVRS